MWYIRLRFWWQGERQHTHLGPFSRDVANRDLEGYAGGWGFPFGEAVVAPYSAIVVHGSDVPVDER